MNTRNTIPLFQKILIFGFFFAAIYVNYNIMPSNLHTSQNLSFIGKFFTKVFYFKPV